MIMIELDNLYERLRTLEDRRDNFFDDGEHYPGDRGYQDILEQIDDVESQIDEYENVDD
jgi:tetrahydromethanopterin S-methyltransferase subunit B